GAADSKSADQPANENSSKAETAKTKDAEGERLAGGRDDQVAADRSTSDRDANQAKPTQPPAAAAPAPRKEEPKKLESLDKVEALRVPTDTAADMSVVKKAGPDPSGTGVHSEREKSGTIRPDDTAPKTQAPGEDPNARRGIGRGTGSGRFAAAN